MNAYFCKSQSNVHEYIWSHIWEFTVGDAESFSTHLRRLRIATGLNQTDFARDLGVEQGTVSRWENGAVSPSFENVTQIATYADLKGLKFGFLGEIVRKTALNEVKKLLPFVKVVGRVLNDDMVEFIGKQDLEKAEEVEAPARSSPQTKALLVDTGELLPLIPVRSILYFHDAPSAPDKFSEHDLLVIFLKNRTARLGRLLAAPNRKFYILGSGLAWLTDLVDRASPVIGIRFR